MEAPACSQPSRVTGLIRPLRDQLRAARLRSRRSWRGKAIPIEDLTAARHVIELAVVRVFEVEETELSAVRRGVARTAHARQVAMYLAHVACNLSLTDVGRMFARDRTTVSYACAVIEDERDDPIFDRSLDLLEWAVPVMAVRPAPVFPGKPAT